VIALSADSIFAGLNANAFALYFYKLFLGATKGHSRLEQEKPELMSRKIELAENYCRWCALGQKEHGGGRITPLFVLLRRFAFLS